MPTTSIVIKNSTAKQIKVYLTLGATAGCIQDVSKIPFIEGGSGLQGWFNLPANGGATSSWAPPNEQGFNGNFCYKSPPLNCATTEMPYATNLGEFIINNGFQPGAPQETLDISGVAGTNAIMKVSMSGGGAWNAGTSHPNVTEFRNKSIGNNVGQIGVYPYLCDTCTSSTSPPSCTTKPKNAPSGPTPQTAAICNVQRDASSNGGTVTLEFVEVFDD